jgi:AraC-like DNA-binding protein
MSLVGSPVAALFLRTPEQRLKVSHMLRGLVLAVTGRTGDWLRAMAATNSRIVAVVDLLDQCGDPNTLFARAVADGAPAVRVIAFGALGTADAETILALGRVGVSAVVIDGSGWTRAGLRTAVTRVLADAPTSLAVRALQSTWPALPRALVAYLSNANLRGLSVGTAALACGLSKRSLERSLSSVDCPVPRALLRFVRLLAAAHLLSRGTQSCELIATETGFSSGSQMRRHLWRDGRLRPRDLRVADDAVGLLVSRIARLHVDTRMLRSRVGVLG